MHGIVALLLLPYNGVSHQNSLLFSWASICKDEQAAQNEVGKPKWLVDFLGKTFFDSCSAHPIRRIEINRYCINCNLSACQYCILSSPHRHHKILKIYRHVYKNVVSLTAMEKYTDCSKIQDEQAAQNEVSKPKWLEDFLGKTFFDSCSAHPIRRNELNRYCINCHLSACQYCVSSGPHRHHNILKIYRHVYKDVVSMAAMNKYIDCSQIQPYKSNKKLVFSLNPLPHCGSALNDEASCNICSRKLTEPDLYRYCSISCKVKAVLRKSDDSIPPFISISSPPCEKQEETPEPGKLPHERQEETPEPQKPQEETSEPQKRKRKRKGTPHRSPLF